jgi:hypothetical protein
MSVNRSANTGPQLHAAASPHQFGPVASNVERLLVAFGTDRFWPKPVE